MGLNKKVYILGAGPAGLALVNALASSKEHEVIVIEKSSFSGGLAATLKWNDYGFHDLGPHKIFTLDQDLLKRVLNLLPPEHWLERKKISSIYMKGHYLNYPPSPFSLLKVYGLPSFTLIVLDYFLNKISSLVGSKDPKSFHEDLVSRLGAKLYGALFEPIALKLWGDPRTLDVKLSKGRVQTPSLLEVISKMLGFQVKSQFEALTFKYPSGGLGKIWESIIASSKNSIFLYNTTLTSINATEDRIKSLVIKNETGSSEIQLNEGDFVFSSVPLSNMIDIMGSSIDAKYKQLAEEVCHLNDLVLVFLKLDVKSLVDESWVFIPDSDICFHRLSEQESFDPGMTPNGTLVCCEIMSRSDRDFFSKSDAFLKESCDRDLKKMGYTGYRIENFKVIRLPKSYPVFKVGYEPKLETILSKLDSFSNLKSIGRQGAFNYIGTLDAMDIGYGAAKWFAESSKNNKSWSDERSRTSHYPVLD